MHVPNFIKKSFLGNFGWPFAKTSIKSSTKNFFVMLENRVVTLLAAQCDYAQIMEIS